ncbi:hypothetical protein ACLBXM_02540 [Xanthobacteraceae bacterium A53D]
MTLHVGTLKEVAKRPLAAAQTRRRAPNWGAFLTHPICLADGETVLERLWDAADVLHSSGQAGEAFDLSKSTLATAASSGSADDIGMATTHLEAYLRHRSLI